MLFSVAVAEDPVALTLESHSVTVQATDDGPVERFAPALEVAPGDVIEWRLLATNTSDELLQSVVLDLPLPGQVAYLSGSARAGLGADAALLEVGAGSAEAGLLAHFSADGGATFHVPPLMRTVIEERDGQQIEVQEAIDPHEYTHARIVLPEFAAGNSFTFVVRTEVR